MGRGGGCQPAVFSPLNSFFVYRALDPPHLAEMLFRRVYFISAFVHVYFSVLSGAACFFLLLEIKQGRRAAPIRKCLFYRWRSKNGPVDLQIKFSKGTSEKLGISVNQLPKVSTNSIFRTTNPYPQILNPILNRQIESSPPTILPKFPPKPTNLQSVHHTA